MSEIQSSTNRKRPREISSKVAVKRNLLKAKKRYDPRFECGEFDRVQYSRDYEFITHMRKREVKVRLIYSKPIFQACLRF